jgi:uncharacterized membrane protein
MKYWFLLFAIVLAALRAPEYLIYAFFLLGYCLYALEQIKKGQMLWIFSILALLPFGIVFIVFPRGHTIPGLVQLGILIGTITLISYVIAGARLVIVKQQEKRLVK